MGADHQCKLNSASGKATSEGGGEETARRGDAYCDRSSFMIMNVDHEFLLNCCTTKCTTYYVRFLHPTTTTHVCRGMKSASNMRSVITFQTCSLSECDVQYTIILHTVHYRA